MCLSDLKFLASPVPDIWKGSQNSKSRSRDPFLTPFDPIFAFFLVTASYDEMKMKNGLLCIAAQCWIVHTVHETLKH